MPDSEIGRRKGGGLFSMSANISLVDTWRTCSLLFLDEMKKRIDVLCSGVMFRISLKSFGAGIVNVEGDEIGWDELEFID